jgi:type II secretory pathway pseudopilin PulG
VAINRKEKKELPEVSVVRNWKEYLGECALIVFSVLLALVLTEYFNSLHEKRQARETLHQLREELITNKGYAQSQYDYHQQVFKNIDSAKRNVAYARKFLDSGRLHLNVLMPQGALLHDLNEVAWQQAKQNNVFKYIDFSTYKLLTDIYDNQERFLNLEPSLERLLISYDSRKSENLQTTLTLMHDVLFGWIVERTPWLVKLYQQAIDELSNY